MGDYVFKLPDIGEGMAEAEVVAWHVGVGDVATADELLVEVMTDKATVEITAPVTGRLTSRAAEAGERVPIGSTLASFDTGTAKTLEPEGMKPPAIEKEREPQPVEEKPVVEEAPKSAPKAAMSKPQQILAAPAVRHRAKALGIELGSISPAGTDGRISHADLDRVLGQTTASSVKTVSRVFEDGADEIKVVGLRRRIAEKMAEAARRIPHFAYIEEADVTALEELRSQLNADAGPDATRLTVLPFFIRAVIRALAEFPQMNATFDDEAEIVRRHHSVHLGVAAQTPNGLMVPVVRSCEGLDLWQIAGEVKRLSVAARDGRAKREELSGSTITITSLGALGGIATTPIINHPEVAIIGPNKVAERPIVKNGQIAIRKMMNISSSFDHRVVDGYDAAAFIQRIKALLEQPAMIFIND